MATLIKLTTEPYIINLDKVIRIRVDNPDATSTAGLVVLEDGIELHLAKVDLELIMKLCIQDTSKSTGPRRVGTE